MCLSNCDKDLFCLQDCYTKRFSNEDLKTFFKYQKIDLFLHENFFQSFSTEKNSFNLEFISLTKTGLENAETAPALLSPSP